ncbi:MAG: Lrp/AsnC family transcriptional regulator [Jiangellaceae bacterium]
MDRVDADLIAALRTHGRASYAELGRLVGMSGPSVQERVRRLEERGVISGYRAVVRPSELGLGVTALIGVLLSDSAGHDDVGIRLEGVPEVEDCWFIAGDEAYMLKVRVPDVQSLEHLLGRLVQIEGVARTRTTLVLSTRWEGRQVPATPGQTGE